MISNEMNNGEEAGSKQVTSENNERSKGLQPQFSKFEVVFLSLTNILTVTTILLNLAYISKIMQLDFFSIFIVNLVMITVSFVGYQMKKIIRKRAFRRLRKETEKEANKNKNESNSSN